jgi:hypothetical protein
MNIKYISYCLISVATLLIIIFTEPLYGTYSSNLWLESLPFISKI